MKAITLAMLAKWLDERLTKAIRAGATKQGFNLNEEALYFAAAIVVIDWASDSGLFPDPINKVMADVETLLVEANDSNE